VDRLDHWLEQMDTSPDIQHCLITSLWLQGSSTFVANATPGVLPAASQQESIGLFGLLVGQLASAWLPIQERYYHNIGSLRTAALWSVRLCCQLLQFTHDLWLDRNHHVLQAREQTALAVAQQEIAEQFHLGIQHLQPNDQFYVTPGPNGFSLAQVSNLPLEDQQLWLQAVRNACIHRQEHLCSSMAHMRQLMSSWLHNPPPIPQQITSW